MSEIQAIQELFDRRDALGLVLEPVAEGVSYLKTTKPKKLPKGFRDDWGTNYVARTNHRQQTFLAQAYGEASEGDFSVVSFETTLEQANTNPAFREPIVKGWLHNAEVINVEGNYAIFRPTVKPKSGGVFAYEGTRVPVKLNTNDFVDTLVSGGMPAPKHDVARGGVYNPEQDFSSVGSYWRSGERRLGAYASRPSLANARGLAAFEKVKPEVVQVGRRELDALRRDAGRYRAIAPQLEE
ncbi:MAG: hypothetical protein HY366_00595 [Candidatus Aenigmarchaeota archaeon]|nr:hypothetical protein [Candidatus Aenigmarchaeota archaeon]